MPDQPAPAALARGSSLLEAAHGATLDQLAAKVWVSREPSETDQKLRERLRPYLAALQPASSAPTIRTLAAGEPCTCRGNAPHIINHVQDCEVCLETGLVLERWAGYAARPGAWRASDLTPPAPAQAPRHGDRCACVLPEVTADELGERSLYASPPGDFWLNGMVARRDCKVCKGSGRVEQTPAQRDDRVDAFWSAMYPPTRDDAGKLKPPARGGIRFSSAYDDLRREMAEGRVVLGVDWAKGPDRSVSQPGARGGKTAAALRTAVEALTGDALVSLELPKASIGMRRREGGMSISIEVKVSVSPVDLEELTRSLRQMFEQLGVSPPPKPEPAYPTINPVPDPASRLRSLEAVRAMAERLWQECHPAGRVVVDRVVKCQRWPHDEPRTLLVAELGEVRAELLIAEAPPPDEVEGAIEELWRGVSDVVARGWRP